VNVADDRLLKSSGNDGINKVIAQFLTNHPSYAKRQIEMKINEVAVKEKRGDDRLQVWHINPEFQQYLEMENFDMDEINEPQVSAPKPKKVKASNAEKSEGKGTIDSFFPSKSQKRKLDDSQSSDKAGNGASSSSIDATPKEPKKLKRAFGFFVKAKRAEAETLVKDPQVRTLQLDHFKSNVNLCDRIRKNCALCYWICGVIYLLVSEKYTKSKKKRIKSGMLVNQLN
jgi:hypothetical protein